LPWVAAALSGVLLALAFPGPDLGPLVLVALVPLLLALRPETRARRAGSLGAVTGTVFFALLLTWLRPFSEAAYAALMLSQAVFVSLFAVGASRLRSPASRLAGLPLLWAGIEVVRGAVPLGGFTWGGLGLAVHAVPSVLKLAPLLGGFGLAGAVAAVNAGIAEALGAAAARGRRHRVSLPCARVVAGMAVVALVFAVARVVPGPPAANSYLDIAVIQGSVPEVRPGPRSLTLVRVIANHLDETARLAASAGTPPDLVIWPENAVDRDPFAPGAQAADIRESVSTTVRAFGRPFLIGTILDAPEDRFFNSNIFWSPEGEVLGRYVKMHLVPFAEYVPWRHLFTRLFTQLDAVPYDGAPGHSRTQFAVDGVRFASVICFESAFGPLVRSFASDGAQFLVVTTNNASFGRSALSRQHLAASQLRAAENGRALVHAALSGISAMIGPDGRVTGHTPLFETTTLRARIPVIHGETVYTRGGQILDASYAAGAAALWLWLLIVAPCLRRRGRREIT